MRRPLRSCARPAPRVPDADERYTLVLEQVTRGLRQQQDSLDNLRARAGTMVAVASVVSSVFGAAALAPKHHPTPVLILTGLALLSLVVALGAASKTLLPYRWRWGIDGHKLLADYVEAEPPADLDEMRRSLGYHMQEDVTANQKKLDRLYDWLRVAVAAIGLEVVCWSLALMLR